MKLLALNNTRHTPTAVNIVLVALIALLALSSCRKDDNFILSNASYSISQDTLLFDTVFTTIGSATRRVKVYNKEVSPIKLKFEIEGGNASYFRMNVDGFQGNSLDEIEIPGNDSVYVFMEVTVDPDMPLSTSPFVIEDVLKVSQDGVTEQMRLIAWGQNANYISQKAAISGLTCNNSSITFSDEKPYVIYGILVVDSCELIIPEGARIHVHGGIVNQDGNVYNDGQIIIFPNGKLTVQGTLDNPVIFEGDRLEPEFSDVPGQWVGIRFWRGSLGNTIEYAELRNGIIGFIADSASSVQVHNTIIKNTSGPNIIGSHATIEGSNLLLYGAGSSNLQLTYGGDYQFDYCTLVNSSNQRSALYVSNYRCTDLQNDPLCTSFFDVYPAQLSMRNSILYGPSEDEILLDEKTDRSDPALLDYQFSNCIVRVDELLDANAYPNFFDRCEGCITYMRRDTLFRNIEGEDFRLDTTSIAENNGLPLTFPQQDLLGFPRDGVRPDIGCYEFEN